MVEMKFSQDILLAMMNGANKADSADFSEDDILNPRGWALLSF